MKNCHVSLAKRQALVPRNTGRFLRCLAQAASWQRASSLWLLGWLLLGALGAQAQPTVTSTSPARNAPAAARSTNVALTYSQAVSAGSVANVRVFSQQAGGRKASVAGTSGSTITVNPNVDFKPGETVFVTSPATVQSSGGAASKPYVYQFTTQAGAGPGTFSGGSDPAVGSNPQSVAVGDVDGDGDLDLLTANYSGGTVSVRLNNGLGVFGSGSDLAVGSYPISVALGDVDGDGDLDMLAANYGSYGSGTVSVRLNNGLGVFSGGSDPAVGRNPTSVALGDVDGDGDLDMLVANFSNNTVSVRLNNGLGSFSGGSDLVLGSGLNSVALGDVDGDGDLDLLAANYSNTVNVRLNNGLGVFSGGSDPAVGTDPYSVALGDVDGDGDLDLLTANYDSGTVSVRLNNGLGVFGGGSDSAVGTDPSSVALGDVDGDGDLDMLAANGNSNTVSVRLNQVLAPTISSVTPGSGAVGTSITITGTNLSGTTSVTFNGTAAPGFLVNATGTSITVSVPAGATTGPILVTTPGGAATSPSSFTVPPLAVVSTTPARNARAAARPTNVALTYNQAVDAATAASVRVYSQQAGGKKAVSATASGSTVTLDPAQDFKPGETVFVTSPRAAAATPYVYQFTAQAGVAAGTFGGGSDFSDGASPQALAAADVDGDGDLDLLVANSGSNTVSVRLNNGSGSFSAGQNVAVGNTPAKVVVADVDGDGDLDLAALNSNINTGSRGSISVRFNNGAGTFSGGQEIGVGTGALGLAAADMDGDGDLDLLATNYDGTVSVRFNNGSGSFSGTTEVAIGGRASASVAAADVDGDGDLDLLAAISYTASFATGTTVSVRLNNGAGVFSGSQEVSVGNGPQDVTAADVDVDGDLDLLTANGDGSTVSVRLNNGAGIFSGTQEVSVGNSPNSVVAADVDGDGDLDLLAANYFDAGNSVSVRLNNGSGSFSGGQNIALGNYLYDLVVADLDGDGDLDFATQQFNSDLVSVRLNQPPLTVTALSPAANARAAARNTTVGLTFSGPIDAATAGNVKVFSAQYRGRRTATASTSGNTVTLTPTASSGAASFQPGETVRVSVPATVHGTSGGAAVPYVYQFTTAVGGPGIGNFQVPAANADPAVGNSPQSVAVGDVDGDGDLDMLTANSGSSTVSVRLNNGSGSFSAPATNPNPAVGSGPGSVVLGDVDGDGDLDMLTANANDNTVSVRLNNGTGNFTAPATNPNPAVGSSPNSVTLGDVDGDGDLDLLTANFGGNTVSVRLNDGTGNFTAPATNANPTVGSGPISVALGDVDGDGDLDLLTANYGGSTVSVRLNDGTGNFTAPATNPNPAVGTAPYSVALGDVDGDGDLDVLAANSGSNTVSVRLNNGTGSFTGGSDPAVGSTPYSVALSDVDADGDLDLLTANHGGNTLSVRLNNGSGSFTAPATNANPAVGSYPTSVALGDVDGDSDLDVLTANSADNTVSVRLNQSAPPVLSSLSASSVVAGGALTLSGTLLTGATLVTFTNTGTGAATTVAASAFTSTGYAATPQTIGLLVPGLAAGTYAVSVTTPNGPSNTLPLSVRPLLVTSLNPAANARAAARSTPVGVTFTEPIDAATAGNVKVFSAQYRGRRTASASTSGNTVTLAPTASSGAAAFKPGETVQVSVPATVHSTGGAAAVPYVYQFTTAVGGPGRGNFRAPAANANPAVGSYPTSVALGDVDGDGDLDVLTANSADNTVSVRLNDGAGNFTGGSDPIVGSNPGSVVLGDVDGDGDLDVLAANYNGNTVSVRLNDGAGNFTAPATNPNPTVDSGPQSVVLGDVDGDGDLDVLTANFNFGGTVSVRLNDGTGNFTAPATNPNPAVGNLPIGLALGDVDGDGDLDLLTTNSYDNTVSVRLNDGTGSFTAPATNPNPTVGSGPQSVALSDVDGDGDLDMLTANADDNTVSVRLNDGTGNFTAPATNPNPAVGNNPSGLALGDVDGDGDLDVLTANFDDNTVSVRLNQPPAPVLSNLSASSAAAGGALTLSGTLLTGATLVTFTNTGTGAATTVAAAAFTSTGYAATPQTIGLLVPAGLAAGSYTVRVTTPGGTSNALPLTVCVLTVAVQNVSVPLGASGTVSVPASAFNNGSTSTCGPVTAQVSSQGTLTGQVNENGLLTLTAPTGAVFTAVTFASYGMPTYANGTYALGSCHAPNSQSVVEAVALGQHTFSISADNVVFGGDPCPNALKQLVVQATYTNAPAAQLTYSCGSVGTFPVLVTLTDANGASRQAPATVTVTVPAATSTTWTGTASTDWTDCQNWSYGRLPDATISAVVPGGLATYPVLASGTGTVQNLLVASGASLTVATGATLEVTGDFTTSDPASLAGTVRLSGSAPVQALSSPSVFGTLLVNKAAGTVVLQANLVVGTALALTGGTLTTGSFRVVLGSTATLTESNTSYVTGAVVTTRPLAAGTAESFGGLGLTLTPATGSTSPGSTAVLRTTGTALSGAGTSQSILRYFDIQPATNTGLNVTLDFSYLDHERNGIAAAGVALFKSVNGVGGPWQAQSPITIAGNTVRKTGISDFSVWTLGSAANPLPVELAAFTAEAQGSTALLRWNTASEHNSDHFEVEASADGIAFGRIGTVAAQGSSLTAHAYRFVDAQLAGYGSPQVYYRLRQVDLDGRFAYSPVRVVAVSAGSPAEASFQVYPTLRAAGEPLRYVLDRALAGQAAGAELTVYTSTGQQVSTQRLAAGATGLVALPPLPTGWYLVRLRTADGTAFSARFGVQ